MKKLSITKMADTIIAKRKEQKLTQAQLAEMTGINRGIKQLSIKSLLNIKEKLSKSSTTETVNVTSLTLMIS